MTRLRTIAEVESEIVALRATAERAGTALACLFSCSDEYEADIVRERRAQGRYGQLDEPGPGRRLRAAAVTVLLALVFLVFG